MELHKADKDLQVVTINMLTYHKQRKFIFLPATVRFILYIFPTKLDSYSEPVVCSFVFQILQGRVYLFLKLPLSDQII